MLVLLAMLALAGLVTAPPRLLKRRDADAAHAAKGLSWFSSFYSLFGDKNNQNKELKSSSDMSSKELKPEEKPVTPSSFDQNMELAKSETNFAAKPPSLVVENFFPETVESNEWIPYPQAHTMTDNSEDVDILFDNELQSQSGYESTAKEDIQSNHIQNRDSNTYDSYHEENFDDPANSYYTNYQTEYSTYPNNDQHYGNQVNYHTGQYSQSDTGYANSNVDYSGLNTGLAVNNNNQYSGRNDNSFQKSYTSSFNDPFNSDQSDSFYPQRSNNDYQRDYGYDHIFNHGHSQTSQGNYYSSPQPLDDNIAMQDQPESPAGPFYGDVNEAAFSQSSSDFNVGAPVVRHDSSDTLSFSTDPSTSAGSVSSIRDNPKLLKTNSPSLPDDFSPSTDLEFPTHSTVNEQNEIEQSIDSSFLQNDQLSAPIEPYSFSADASLDDAASYPADFGLFPPDSDSSHFPEDSSTSSPVDSTSFLTDQSYYPEDPSTDMASSQTDQSYFPEETLSTDTASLSTDSSYYSEGSLSTDTASFQTEQSYYPDGSRSADTASFQTDQSYYPEVSSTDTGSFQKEQPYYPQGSLSADPASFQTDQSYYPEVSSTDTASFQKEQSYYPQGSLSADPASFQTDQSYYPDVSSSTDTASFQTEQFDYPENSFSTEQASYNSDSFSASTDSSYSSPNPSTNTGINYADYENLGDWSYGSMQEYGGYNTKTYQNMYKYYLDLYNSYQSNPTAYAGMYDYYSGGNIMPGSYDLELNSLYGTVDLNDTVTISYKSVESVQQDNRSLPVFPNKNQSDEYISSTMEFPNKHTGEVVTTTIPLGFSLNDPGVELPSEECLSSQGNVGECKTPYQCGVEGGVPDGLCHQGYDAYYHLRSCCIFKSLCGYVTNKEVTYLRNEGHPELTNRSASDCYFKIDLLKDVCQLRIDFLEFEMKPMSDGECDESNALAIKGPNAKHSKLICGTINKETSDFLRTDHPHLYYHVSDDPDYINEITGKSIPNRDKTSVLMKLKVKDYSSRWNLKFTQITCDGANLQAPHGCDQYYNTNSGNISSFNLLDGEYPKNLRLSACIKKDPTACALELRIKKFSLGQPKGAIGKPGYGLVCKDYLVINGEKTAICGTLPSRPMYFHTGGPQFLTLHTDDISETGDVGFSLEYYHHQTCNGLDFFTFPSKK